MAKKKNLEENRKGRRTAEKDKEKGYIGKRDRHHC
jgi:hypothetical protein